MFCKRNGYFTRHCNNCSHINFDKCGMETKCDNVYSNYNMDNDSCACGFDEEFNVFPENPMYGQSYVPIQVMGRVSILDCKRIKEHTQALIRLLRITRIQGQVIPELALVVGDVQHDLKSFITGAENPLLNVIDFDTVVTFRNDGKGSFGVLSGVVIPVSHVKFSFIM